MARSYAQIIQSVDHFDGAHTAEVPIVVSTVKNRVDVRAKQEDRQLFRGCAQTEDISGGIHAHLQTRLPHQAGDVFSRSQVGFGVSEASHAAFGILSELAELFERAL